MSSRSDYTCQFCQGPLILTGDSCWDKSGLLIGKCSSCELVQVVDFYHVSENHYASDDYFPPDLECARRREWDWNRKRVARIRQLVPDVSKKKALDFGCGHGGFLQQGQGVFRQVIGFDLNPRACKAHQTSGWLCVNDLQQVPRDIDIILLFHVLEHLPKPWEMLVKLRRHFPSAQLFVIEVPNTDEALNSLFNNAAYRNNHHGSDHVYYFTSQTLRRVIESVGLEVILDSQLQRYTLANNLGWLSNNRGGGQDLWDFFNDEHLNYHYEQVLISQKKADSIFMVCRTGA